MALFVENIGNYFYVNDFSGGDTSFEKAIKLYKKLRVRFAGGYFNLRKWRTNNANLRKLNPETAQNDITPQKILGVLWDEIDDTFVFDFKEIVELSETLPAIKTLVLKTLTMFFDRLAYFNP